MQSLYLLFELSIILHVSINCQASFNFWNHSLLLTPFFGSQIQINMRREII
uniref:Uncharacterized protein n=1 Tax=Rhizophora mucronata TaxID=61149 RepID=A0A2P2NXC4_RHIMU